MDWHEILVGGLDMSIQQRDRCKDIINMIKNKWLRWRGTYEENFIKLSK